MSRRQSTNEQQRAENRGSASVESDSDSSVSSGDDSAIEHVSSSGDDGPSASASESSDPSSEASNQSSTDPTRHSELRRTHRRRHGNKIKRGKRQQERSAARFGKSRGTLSSWLARERQFEKFRAGFVVLPVPEGVIRIDKARGYCLYVKSVVNWVIPESILTPPRSRTAPPIRERSKLAESDGVDESDEDEDALFTLGVHVSLFHAPSKRFFGNTWVSPEICIDASLIKPDREPKSNALRYVAHGVALNFRAYFLSEIVDPNCVGIVELVAYRKDPDSKATVTAAGCGWTILPLFAQPVGDAPISRGNQAPTATLPMSTSSGESVGVFTGSPRVLWELQGAAEWQTYPRHEQSKFYYQLQPYESLLTLGTSGFMRRNELVGALEVIPGLRHGNLAGIDAGTNPKMSLLRDIGSGEDDEDDIAVYEDALSSFVRMASLVPRSIQLEESFTLNIQAVRAFIHMRSEVEANLIARLKLSRRTIHEGATSIDDGHVSARVLKLALHNGRCFRTRHHTIPLKVDDGGSAGGGGDDTMRSAQSAPAHLKGFIFHPYMAVVVSLQFTVHFRVTWAPKLKQQAMESRPMKVLPEDDVVTVTMASRIVVPSDGKKLFLYDKDHPSNNDDSRDDRRKVLHVDLLSGPPCRPYSENPIYTPPDHIIGAGRHAQSKSQESIAFADLVLTVDGEGNTGKTETGESATANQLKADQPNSAAEHWANKILAKAGANSVLAQTLNALATTAPSSSTRSLPDSSKKSKEERGTSPVRPASPVKKLAPASDPSPVIDPTAFDGSELSRASKTLLMRNGFVDAHDTTAVYGTGGVVAKPSKKTVWGESPATKTLRAELDDIYKAHEIRLHMAAFRVTQDSPLTKTALPTRLYFTFQFYCFAPTRTETLRLSNAFAASDSSRGPGQTFLLMRERPANKPSLAIQFDVDSTVSQNPLEHREFASYLLHKQLYVDVWDADSLFLLGTCAIPLHELLRQGAGVKKYQGEFDVWEGVAVLDNPSVNLSGESSTSELSGESTPTELADVKQPRNKGGATIGKLQILLSNYGLKGRDAVGPVASSSSSRPQPVSRAHTDASTTKAKHRVRARPLVDSNAELYRLLTDQGFYGGRSSREGTTANQQHRQLVAARNTGDATTLTPKEIDILCELFRANPQASGPKATRIVCDRDGKRGLTALLSLKSPVHSMQPAHPAVPPLRMGEAVSAMPSVGNSRQDPVTTLRNHLKRVLERAMDKGVRIHQVFMDFDASGDGNLCFDELERALEQLGVDAHKNEPTAKAVLRQLLRQFDSDGNGSVSYTEFLISFGISVEENKKEVVQTTTVDMETAVREVFQRLQAKGIDVEELFDHFDTDKSGSLDMHELKKALKQCLQTESGANAGNLLALLKEDALRRLMQRVNKNGDDVVDYHEFLAFCGVATKTPREEKQKRRALSQAERKLIKLLLRAMRMGMSVTDLFSQFDSNADGAISIREFATSLDALFQTKSSLSEADIGAITKRFDANGDGDISFTEFKAFVEEIRAAQEQLTKVLKPLMDQGQVKVNDTDGTVPLLQWAARCAKEWKMAKPKVDEIVRWMETVDLVDDKQRVNLVELQLVVSPPPVTKRQHTTTEKKAVGVQLREFLADAVRQGVDARGCFAHFDPDGDGEVTTVELKNALRQLGGAFKDVSDRAIDAMVGELDADDSGKISFAEFERLLPASTVNEANVPPKSVQQKTKDVLVWLTNLLASAVAGGMDVDACFGHFDKNKDGAITREEFAQAMQELPGVKEALAGDNEHLLTQVMDRIDGDRSGEISLAEFKRLFPRGDASVTTDSAAHSSVEPAKKDASKPTQLADSAVERLRALLKTAENGGVSVATSFGHFDVDKDGIITRGEFVTMIKALPGFENTADAEIVQVVAVIDANGSGSISLEEFKGFVDGKTPETKTNTTKFSMANKADVSRAYAKKETNALSAAATDTVPTFACEEANKDVGEAGPNEQTVESGDAKGSPGESNGAVTEAAGEVSKKGKLQRAGSFSVNERSKGAAAYGAPRANTDSESFAVEATQNKQSDDGGTAKPTKVPPMRRPSLAETRAAAKKAMESKAASQGAASTTPTDGATTGPERPTREEELVATSDAKGEASTKTGDVGSATVQESADDAESSVSSKPEEQGAKNVIVEHLQEETKPPAESKTSTPARRSTLAEARAAAKAAKASGGQQEGIATEGVVVVAAGANKTADTSAQGARAKATSTAAAANPDGDSSVAPSTTDAVEVNTERAVVSKQTSDDPKQSEREGETDAAPSCDMAAPSSAAARRPSLAEARAAARLAPPTKAASVATGKPPVGARRPSLAETRAAAKTATAAVKAKSSSDVTKLEPAVTSTPETHRGLVSLQSLLLQAQASGLVLETALSHFDKDENGTLTYDEFASGLKALSSDFAGVPAEAALGMAKWIDRSATGHITLQDFEVFIQTPIDPLAGGRTAAAATQESPSVGETVAVKNNAIAPATAAPVSEASDVNTNAKTTKPALARSSSLAARAAKKPSAAKPVASESEAVAAIAPTTTSATSRAAPPRTSSQKAISKDNTGPAPVPVASATDARGYPPHEPHPPREQAPPSDNECAYEFHSDPTIRSVEVKLRRAAIDAYSRGVLPLRIVHKFLEASGHKGNIKSSKSELRRVEFLQVLMEMGFSLLSDAGEAGEEDDAGAARGPRMHDQLYARQLERLARYKHHIKEESRAEKALVRAVRHTQQRASKQSKKAAASGPAASVNRFVQDKSQLMRVLSYYRDGHKKSLVYSLLRDQVTTQVALFPSFASLLFAEMHFVNPYPHQERFRLEFLATPAVVDADIVKSSDEWQFYRRHVPLAYGDASSCVGSSDSVEHDMIDPHNEVVLDANDQISIPVKLRWLQPTTSSSVATSSKAKASAAMSLAVRSCTHGHTVALFKLELFTQPFVCHRVLRFVHPAGSVWKWTVRCPRGKHLVCLDPSVAAVAESSPTGNATAVTLKCRVGAYPSLEDFYVVLYDDEFFARIDEIWQIRIQAAMRLDVHALLGQTVRSELVVRGDAATSQRKRHVRCFTTWHHAHHVSFRPTHTFQLVGDAYHRIEWRFCAVELPAPSLCRVRVHLVDVETLELVGSWLLHVSLARPAVTKSYELMLPRVQAAQKKIAYTNAWDQPQTVVLRSSDPARMRPRDAVLQIPPQGQIFLRLVFPAPAPRLAEATSALLLFVNDQQTEQSEECLRFQVGYN